MVMVGTTAGRCSFFMRCPGVARRIVASMRQQHVQSLPHQRQPAENGEQRAANALSNEVGHGLKSPSIMQLIGICKWQVFDFSKQVQCTAIYGLVFGLKKDGRSFRVAGSHLDDLRRAFANHTGEHCANLENGTRRNRKLPGALTIWRTLRDEFCESPPKIFGKNEHTRHVTVLQCIGICRY